MSDPISILVELNSITLQLNGVQTRIDSARSAHPTNGLLQLQLDRKQAAVDERRRVVEMVKLDIASRN